MCLPLLRVVAISIVLAVLGVLFILLNPHDRSMVGFGWFLVVVGSVIAGAFLYVWARKQMTEVEREAGTKPTRGDMEASGKKGRAKGGPRRRR